MCTLLCCCKLLFYSGHFMVARQPARLWRGCGFTKEGGTEAEDEGPPLVHRMRLEAGCQGNGVSPGERADAGLMGAQDGMAVEADSASGASTAAR